MSKTVTFKGFTNNGVNRVGYKRKKKTKKTQQVQYADDDHHPFQSRIISYSGMSFNEQDEKKKNLFMNIFNSGIFEKLGIDI